MRGPQKILGILTVASLFCLTLAGCVAPLTLEITSPEDGAEITESPVTVAGTVSAPEATVTVNSKEVDVAADGSFPAQVELSEGKNIIEVVAMLGEQEKSEGIMVTATLGGQESVTKTVTITYTPSE